MYNKISVTKPGGISPGSAAAKNPNVTIVDAEDILFFPPRDSKGVHMPGNFVMKENARMIQVYMTASKISAPYESDGEEDSINIKQMFEGQHPGNNLEIREFIQNWLGRNIIIIHGTCADTVKTVVGTPCAPLQLKPSGQDNNDGRFHMLKFEAFNTSQFVPGHYTGALPMAEPTLVADAVAIEVNAEGGAFYKLPASVAGLEVGEPSFALDTVDLNHGDVVSFLGTGLVGSADPVPIIDSGVSGPVTIILRNGSSWAGFSGASISFRYYNGGATKYLIEEARG